MTKLKQKLKGNIVKKIIKKIFYFYNNLETICPEELDIKSTDKILILAPHADDESIGCGGLLLKYANQCDVVCVTNCKTGNPNVNDSDAISERKNEFKFAMNAINVKYYFNEDIDSDNLKNSYDLFEGLMNEYKLETYSFIALPIWYDQHNDHKALVKFFGKFIDKKQLKCKILFYEVWSTIAIPNKFIDLSEILNEKYKLINYYKSQISMIDYGDKIKGLNIYRGMIVNKKAAEVYLEMDFSEFKELEL